MTEINSELERGAKEIVDKTADKLGGEKAIILPLGNVVISEELRQELEEKVKELKKKDKELEKERTEREKKDKEIERLKKELAEYKRVQKNK